MAFSELHLVVLLLVVMLLPCVSSKGDCALTVTAECTCGEFDGGHELWCPDSQDYNFRLYSTSGQLQILCNPQKDITASDLILQAKGLNIGKPLESLQLESCPILSHSYSELIGLMNVTYLKELIIKDGREDEETLVTNQFSGMDTLLALKLQEIRLVNLSADAFQGLPKLRTLRLHSNGLKVLPPDLFKPLTVLEYLDILETDLTQLPPVIFEGQGRLMQLKISAFSLTALPPKVFSPLTKLERLDIIRMNLTEGAISPDLFSSCSSLKTLNVSGRGFEFAPANLFASTSLESFDWTVYTCVAKNCSVNLQNSFLKDLATLTSFGFSRSSRVTTTIAEDFFQGCYNLAEVNMYLAGLTSLPAGIFRDNSALKKIDLGRNKITELQDTTFMGLTRLKELNLDGNALSRLRDETFVDLRMLRVLNASNNVIKTLEERVFNALSSLEELNLENNGIAFNDDNQPKWQSMTSLKTLNLANNSINITEFPYSWLTGLLELRSLNLSHNFIGQVLDVMDLDFKQTFIKVDLSYNRIKTVSFERALKQSNLASSGRQGVRIVGNPIDCGCNSLNLSKFIHGNLNQELSNFRVKFQHEDGILCAEPADLLNQKLSGLSYDKFYCSFPSDDMKGLACPEPCSCRFVPSTSQTEIDCHERNMTIFPAFIPVATSTSAVTVNLCDNSITHLSSSQLPSNYSVISELQLCQNEIVQVHVADLPPTLKKLNLADNRISSFDDDTIKYLQQLDAIYLGNNQFPCDCASTSLYDFVRKYSALIVDLNNVTIRCKQETRAILDWDREDLCTELLDIVLPVVFFLVVIILISIIMCLRYKQPISIWIYSHRTLRRICFIEDLEDRPYDAFISYSGDDADFVERQLVPGLESPTDSKLHYRCLVHNRDFDVGRPIVEQIGEAVDSSRRTVVILSKNFVRSHWYEHEFDLAHSRRRVIVVVFGDLPTETEMGPLMWQYIQTNTYLAHSDPWFWDKLRYALPHRGRKSQLSSGGGGSDRKHREKIQMSGVHNSNYLASAQTIYSVEDNAKSGEIGGQQFGVPA